MRNIKPNKNGKAEITLGSYRIERAINNGREVLHIHKAHPGKHQFNLSSHSWIDRGNNIKLIDHKHEDVDCVHIHIRET